MGDILSALIIILVENPPRLAPIRPRTRSPTSTHRPTPPTQPPIPLFQAPVTQSQAPAPPSQAPVTKSQAPAPPTQAPVTPTQAPVPQVLALIPPTRAPVPPTPAPTPAPPGNFLIRLVNVGTVTTFDEIFQEAANRWMELIVGDVPDLPEGFVGDWFGGFFGPDQANSDFVDDVIIGYEFTTLLGDFIGTAGPRFVRNSDGTTISGIMQFDLDFFMGSSSSTAAALILHEMGHVLGVGTRWDNAPCDNACAVDNTVYNYACSGAVDAYHALNLGSIGTPNLQLENEGGVGSACGHWDDASFNSPIWTELMIYYIDSSRVQLLTTVTLGSLSDIGGYEVNMAAADPIPDPNAQSLDYGIRSTETIDVTATMNDIEFFVLDDRRAMKEVDNRRVLLRGQP